MTLWNVELSSTRLWCMNPPTYRCRHCRHAWPLPLSPGVALAWVTAWREIAPQDVLAQPQRWSHLIREFSWRELPGFIKKHQGATDHAESDIGPAYRHLLVSGPHCNVNQQMRGGGDDWARLMLMVMTFQIMT
ncbi:hypothetical protein PoB_000964900 [Plakobranchus ocellatus]|uniref:Uncharacterized protein n=1 Tax=Plakobranchus ocellatus TaxID=259542 RepID=A0AAV3YJF3_9GAST|nr:hypothetical protein PoB_000964900 [Plakobranchus ocellatus]